MALLETQMRALSAGDETVSRRTTPAPTGSDSDTTNGQEALTADFQGLVDGYSTLLEFTQYVKIRGLMLDPEFCERVEREWTVKTLLSYMISAEKSLKEQASEAHEQAAALLSKRAAGPAAGRKESSERLSVLNIRVTSHISLGADASEGSVEVITRSDEENLYVAPFAF